MAPAGQPRAGAATAAEVTGIGTLYAGVEYNHRREAIPRPRPRLPHAGRNRSDGAARRHAGGGCPPGRPRLVRRDPRRTAGRVAARRRADQPGVRRQDRDLAVGARAARAGFPRSRRGSSSAARWTASAGRFRATLVVQGSGDPDFHVENGFLVAQALNELGVERVTGAVIVNQHFWMGWENGSDGPRARPGQARGADGDAPAPGARPQAVGPRHEGELAGVRGAAGSPASQPPRVVVAAGSASTATRPRGRCWSSTARNPWPRSCGASTATRTTISSGWRRAGSGGRPRGARDGALPASARDVEQPKPPRARQQPPRPASSFACCASSGGPASASACRWSRCCRWRGAIRAR